MVRITVLSLLLSFATVAVMANERILYLGDGLSASGFKLSDAKITQNVLGLRDANGQTFYATLQAERVEGPLPGPPTLRVITSMGHRFSLRDIEPLPETPPIIVPPPPTLTNQCVAQATILEPGTYLVVVRGGRGGDGGGTLANGAAPGLDAIERRFRVELDTPMVAYMFRGGNGNPGGIGNTAGAGSTAAAGGGASGAPSAIVLCPLYEVCDTDNSKFFISEGGAGGRGAGARNNQGQFLYGRGAGGGFGPYRDGEAGSASAAAEFSVGGGGGGAPGGRGGAGFVYIPNQWFSEPGQDAVGLASGAGGRGYSMRPNGLLQFGAGGPAGAGTITWTCAGYTLHAYGGGSGGGLATRNQIATGGAGGSGTGTQTTHSTARVYRLDDDDNP